MDRESIAQVAMDYLRQELRCPKFEVLLVDALVASEVYAFGEELKRNPSRYSKRFSFDELARSTNEYRAYEEAKGNLDKLGWRLAEMGFEARIDPRGPPVRASHRFGHLRDEYGLGWARHGRHWICGGDRGASGAVMASAEGSRPIEATRGGAPNEGVRAASQNGDGLRRAEGRDVLEPKSGA